jgi:programmed cell death 6-interacting protein
MLAIPCVVATTKIETSTLSRLLAESFNVDREQISVDVALLEGFRSSAIASSENLALIHQSLLRYCHHIKSAQARLVDIDSALNLNLGWRDAFDPKSQIIKSTLSFDKLCCVWNLACLESQMGARVDRQTEDGIRLATKHFQQAAGYFESLCELINTVPPPILPCFAGDCLNMMKQLMLAQAQLCFYEKALSDRKAGRMKSSIIAKLASQTAIFYSESEQYCSKLRFDQSWYAIIDFQFKSFQSLAEYWQAIGSKEDATARGSGYGEEIVRLSRAERYIRQALEVSNHCTVQYVAHVCCCMLFG